MTSRCNLICDGCYYYTGEKQHSSDHRVAAAWRDLMCQERQRGINFVVLAGAEPSLVPDLCRVCYQEIPLGCVATNGIVKIPSDIGYTIHVSVWGNDHTSRDVRGAACLDTQLSNYASDHRAVFVYTFNRHNIEEAEEVVDRIVTAGGRVTFNQFSAPMGYSGDLSLDVTARRKMATVMARLLRAYPQQVLYSSYNIEVHSGSQGLHDRFGCPYPRRNKTATMGIGKTFRHYRSDLRWDGHDHNGSGSCCVPDTDCKDCRHYAAGSAVVSSKLFRHATDRHHFAQWLDYVDTYLAVWVLGYPKGNNLVPTADERAFR